MTTTGSTTPTALEIFSGAGGLAIGLADAGFHHTAVIDFDENACETIRLNKKNGFAPFREMEVLESDVREVDFSRFSGKVDLLAGGPPCQPFSRAGKRKGRTDKRDMFPEAIRAIRQVRPKFFVFENVRGIIRPAFSNYLEYIKLQMIFPGSVRRQSEKWTQHHARLERLLVKGQDQEYRLIFKTANSADYGTPQRRERVFFVGVRSDLKLNWNFPEPTHSKDALLYQKWGDGVYWERHNVPKRNRPKMPKHLTARLEKISGIPGIGNLAPWKTVRDALNGLPEPTSEAEISHHIRIPGARRYDGHTGSVLDDPAKTLKAGSHGVPGGENMLQHQNGRVRYFTIRECARLQDIPDVYEFAGPWSAQIKQVGNAVPSKLGEVIGKSLLSHLRPSTPTDSTAGNSHGKA